MDSIKFQNYLHALLGYFSPLACFLAFCDTVGFTTFVT